MLLPALVLDDADRLEWTPVDSILRVIFQTGWHSAVTGHSALPIVGAADDLGQDSPASIEVVTRSEYNCQTS